MVRQLSRVLTAPRRQLFRSPRLEESLEGLCRQLSALCLPLPAEKCAETAEMTRHLRHLCLLLYLLHTRDALALRTRQHQVGALPDLGSSPAYWLVVIR